MRQTYRALAHHAGCLRKKHRLSPLEAASCALWLGGALPRRLDELAARMAEIKDKKRRPQK